MVAELVFLYCPECRRDCLAEAPPCGDGHGERCPDRACVECGTALLVDAPIFEFAPPQARSATGPRRRSAA